METNKKHTFKMLKIKQGCIRCNRQHQIKKERCPHKSLPKWLSSISDQNRLTAIMTDDINLHRNEINNLNEEDQKRATPRKHIIFSKIKIETLSASIFIHSNVVKKTQSWNCEVRYRHDLNRKILPTPFTLKDNSSYRAVVRIAGNYVNREMDRAVVEIINDSHSPELEGLKSKSNAFIFRFCSYRGRYLKLICLPSNYDNFTNITTYARDLMKQDDDEDSDDNGEYGNLRIMYYTSLFSRRNNLK
jgi:hypothetical protein